MTQEALAQKSGLTRNSILLLENGKDSLSAATRLRVAEALNCAIEELETPDDSIFGALDKRPKGLLSIKRYDVRASAGDGMLITQEDMIGDISFTSDFLLKITTSQPDKLAFIEVKGDSMHPTFKDGDSILIDRNKRDVETGGVFVLRVGDLLKVKRVTYDPFNQVLRLISDNKDSVGGERIFPDYKISFDNLGNINVVGRVIWCGKSV